MQNKQKLQDFAQNYISAIADDESDGATYRFSLEDDIERQGFYINITLRQHGIDTSYKIDHDFVDSTEYTKIKVIQNRP